jgi:hypothetical protein
MKLLHYGVPTTSIVLSTPLIRNAYRLRRASRSGDSGKR